MSRKVFHFKFAPGTDMEAMHESLALAGLCVEGLLGETAVRLGLKFAVDEKKRTCVIDASNEVGETAGRVFTGLITREFGADSFSVSSPAIGDTVASAAA